MGKIGFSVGLGITKCINAHNSRIFWIDSGQNSKVFGTLVADDDSFFAALSGRRHLSKIEDKPGPRLPALNLLESTVNFLESPYLAFHLCSPAGMQFERLGQIYAIPND